MSWKELGYICFNILQYFQDKYWFKFDSLKIPRQWEEGVASVTRWSSLCGIINEEEKRIGENKQREMSSAIGSRNIRKWWELGLNKNKQSSPSIQSHWNSNRVKYSKYNRGARFAYTQRFASVRRQERTSAWPHTNSS